MKKLLLLLIALSVFTVNAQTLSNLVFETTITPTTTSVDLTFDFDGVSAGDTFEWQLVLALPDGSPDWGSGRNIAYSTGIIPNATGSGTQTVSIGTDNTPVDGEVFTWTGKITLASDGSDTGYNNTGNLVTIITTLDLDNVNENNIRVYPNPTSGWVNMSLELPSIQTNGTVVVMDLNGKVLQSFELDSDEIQVNLETYPAGVYFIKVNTLGSVHTAKVLKK